MKRNKGIVTGLLGYPVKHSLSPAIHNFLYTQQNLVGEYKLFSLPPENLVEFFSSIDMSDWKGINVTAPYKQTVVSYVHRLSPQAEECGAINLIIKENGKLYGDNVDRSGFLSALQINAVTVVDKTVLVLGAGGAARAVVAALSDLNPAQINVIARQMKQAQDIAKTLTETHPDIKISGALWDRTTEYRLIDEADIIINATPLGMWPSLEEYPTIERPAFRDTQVVIDLIYNPLKTGFLKIAEQSGSKVMNGLDMLLEQAYISFEKIHRIRLNRADLPDSSYWFTWIIAQKSK